MADINSNKNAIIIQPITLQIRAPFQFLTNQRAIKHTHYSESRDGLNAQYCTDIHREYGSRLMAKEEKSTFQISSLLLSSFISNIYTPERLLLAKSAKQSKGKGVSRSQLQCQATTALRKNSVHLNRARVIEINVCEL